MRVVSGALPSWGEHAWQGLIAWVEAAYPDEGCGLIACDQAGQHRVKGCHNQFVRRGGDAAQRAFELSAADVWEVWRQGDTLVAFFHSHPDAPETLSAADIVCAVMPGTSSERRTPAYPGVDHVVVSVRAGRAQALSVFRFSRASAALECVGRASLG